MEEKKMVYNPKNAKDVEGGLPAGLTTDGVIVNIDDGVVKQFIKNTIGWKGDLDCPAIQVAVELTYKTKQYTFFKLFTYKSGPNGETEVNVQSNLGKYKKFYKKMPEVNDIVKCMTNADGFWKLLPE